MTRFRERPSDTEIQNWVTEARASVLAHATQRRWWRRLSRPTVAASAMGAVLVGGIAYAAVERTRTPESPELHSGNAVFEIGAPGPGDKWLNVSMTYRCRPGEKFELKDDASVIMWADCDEQSFPDENDPTKIKPGPGGLSTSIPVNEVTGTELVVTGTLTDNYVVHAEYGPTTAAEQAPMLPPSDGEGKPTWVIPTYPVNEYGLTVGQIREGVPEFAYPDLIPVTYRGKTAYLLRESFIIRESGRPGGWSPAEEDRRRGQRWGKDGTLYQRVYAADGRTFLGWNNSGFRRNRCTAC